LAAAAANKRLHLQLIEALGAASMALVEPPQLLHQDLAQAAAVAKQ
jgi:hypothetical protein